MVAPGVSMFMSKKAPAVKSEHKVATDVKEYDYQYCEVCGSNISHLNDLVKVIQADTERLLWISVGLMILALDSRSETYRD